MGININLFNINHNLADIAKGKCLISEPFSPDSYFGRSVVLITEHSPTEGTLGYILNKPVEIRLKDLLPNFPEFAAQCFVGGPVNPETIQFIHTRPDLLAGSTQIMEGIFWGGDIELLKELIKAKSITPREIRFYLGYSGWSPEQIIQEIDEKYWVVSDISTKQIMLADENSWKDILKSLGQSYELWANSPTNPGMN